MGCHIYAFNWMVLFFQGEKGSTGPPGPQGFLGTPVCLQSAEV